jgi:hypothetical protein
MGFRMQRFHHLLPSKLQGFRLLPRRDSHPQARATLRWARYYRCLTPKQKQTPKHRNDTETKIALTPNTGFAIPMPRKGSFYQFQ